LLAAGFAAQYTMTPEIIAALLREGANGKLRVDDGRTVYDFASGNWIAKSSPVCKDLDAARQER
jgi:hypothetical protein